MGSTTSLQAWLEYTDHQTRSVVRADISKNTMSIGRGSNVDIRLFDPQSSEIHAILTCESGKHVLRDLSSKNGTFVNGRPVIEAELNHLDKLQIGSTKMMFCLAYRTDRPAAAVQAAQAKASHPAPGRNPGSGATLNPLNQFLHPVRFWRQAMGSSVFNINRSWPFYFLSIAALAASTLYVSHGVMLVHLGLLLMATTLALGFVAVTCSVFFAFDSLPDAPHRLSQALRFTFYSAPLLLVAQGAYLAWAGHFHPRPQIYYLATLAPTTFFWAFVSLQSRCAFGAGTTRAFAFSLTASVPWNLFMTGLMSFTV